MKKINIILFAILGLAFVSCQTNEITFPVSTVDLNKYSEVRVVNAIPVTGNSDTLLFNNVNYSSVSTALGGYYPLSTPALPKYFTVPFGNDSVSLRFLAKKTTPTVPAFTYKGSMTLTKGKWSAYIYNKTKNPILLQDSDQVPSTDAWKDTVCFVRVANFFFKADGVNPFGKLTLKVQKDKSTVWETVASNVDFGTQSFYYHYKLKNTAGVSPWSGTESNITFAIFDSNGVQYQQFTSDKTSDKGAYSLTLQSFGKGRAYVIYIIGKEGTTNNTDQTLNLKQYLPL
jgi:hypothetical protein